MAVSEAKREAATYAAIGSKLPEPDTLITERPGWYQFLTPSAKDVSFNEVILSRLPPSTPEREAERIAEETARSYRELGLPFKWAIGPMSGPSALKAAVASRAAEQWDFRGMVTDTGSRERAGGSPGVTAELVDESNLAEYVDVFVRGWKTEGQRPRTERNAVRMTAPGSIFRLYLARVDGVPAGVAGTVLKPGYGYLIAAVVLESFRGAGAYRTLVEARLGDLARMGMPFAVTQARESTSAPILEYMGFETAYRAKIYRFA